MFRECAKGSSDVPTAYAIALRILVTVNTIKKPATVKESLMGFLKVKKQHFATGIDKKMAAFWYKGILTSFWSLPQQKRQTLSQWTK